MDAWMIEKRREDFPFVIERNVIGFKKGSNKEDKGK
jgi:hypothetical protein